MFERGKRANCGDYNEVIDDILENDGRVLEGEHENKVVDSFMSVTKPHGNVRFVRETKVLCGNCSDPQGGPASPFFWTPH